MREPKRIWWARPRKLCALERPGGGGRSHRPERRAAEIEWLKAHDVRTVVSTMPTRHNLAAYEEAGLRWLHLPPGERPEDTLDALVVKVRGPLRRGGAVAIHGNRRTDFATAACIACLYEVWQTPPEIALEQAEAAGMEVTDEVAALVGALWV